MNAWVSNLEFRTKKGERIKLRRFEDLEQVDFTKRVELYGESFDHELILLALSAEIYPSGIEKMARQLFRIVKTQA